MPTPPTDNLLHDLSALGAWRQTERHALREAVADQAEKMADLTEANERLTRERDEWQRRALTAEAALRTAKSDAQALRESREAQDRAAWRGRDEGVLKCIATGKGE